MSIATITLQQVAIIAFLIANTPAIPTHAFALV